MNIDIQYNRAKAKMIAAKKANNMVEFWNWNIKCLELLKLKLNTLNN